LYLPGTKGKGFKAWVVVVIDYFTKAAEPSVIYEKIRIRRLLQWRVRFNKVGFVAISCPAM
jgi:hypothetical protein